MLSSFLTRLADLQSEASSTATLAVTVLVGGWLATALIERGKSPETHRFWRLTVRHVATAIFVMGLFVIWRKELQTLLLALGAATAGFLVAFRENWLSLMGFWVRVVKRTYGLDDFIEIDGQRGRVTDVTWLTTTVAETTSSKEGLSYTGRVIHIPNNRMLLAPLAVEDSTSEFSAHTMKLPLPLGADILLAEKLLIDAAEKHCFGYADEAERHMETLRKESHLDVPTAPPRCRIHIAEHGAATLLLRIVVPFKERARIEQAILHEFLSRITPETWPKPPKK